MQRCSADSVVNTANCTWNNEIVDRCIDAVLIGLQKVIYLINNGDGGNVLIETKRLIKISD